MIARKKLFGMLLLGLFSFATLLLINACTYTTPEAENPTPGLEDPNTLFVTQNGVTSIRKSFFGIEINQDANTWENKRIPFMCGWAPVTQAGRWKNALGLSATPYQSMHCNMEFHISPDGKNLEARQVDVDYGNFKKWNLLFSIPIQSHYFYERVQDSRGRELNQFAKVQRKNWQLAPIMDLNINGIRFYDRNKAPYGYIGQDTISHFDVEASIENDKRYFAFTTTQTALFYGSNIQHEMRFNFLEIKNNPNFIPTKYNVRNSKHMNILHILASKPNAVDQISYAAHWDFSKPVEICINGFPNDGGSRDYQSVAIDVIKEVNQGLIDAEVIKKPEQGFVISKKEFKYDYDLRCPSITWVDDRNLAFGAPLGIGLVNTNIRTGEILWGGAVIWGGFIDHIINRDRPSATDELARATHKQYENIENLKHHPLMGDLAHGYPFQKWAPKLSSFQNYASQLPDYKLKDLLSESIKNKKEILDDLSADHPEDPDKRKRMEFFISNLEDFTKHKNFLNPPEGTASDSFQDAFRNDSVDAFDRPDGFQDVDQYLDRINLYSRVNRDMHFSDEEKQLKSLIHSDMSADEVEIAMWKRFYYESNDQLFDMENTVEMHYDGWISGLENHNYLTKPEAARSIVKHVTLHEMGHVIGLGHQFEGNRLPKQGTVPSKVYNRLAQEAEKNFNYSSIMDYPDPHTEVTLPYKKVAFQEHDRLVMRYLYNQQVTTFDAEKDDWKYFPLDKTGIIPNAVPHGDKHYPARYLPQCNDYDSWVGDSPFCRKWDRGYSARTIVEENFSRFTDSFLSKVNAFSEAKGGRPWLASYRLWARTYNMVNDNRTFYDYFRLKLQENENYRRIFRKFQENWEVFHSFSRACIDPDLAPKKFRRDFAELTLTKTPTKTEYDLLSLQKATDYDSVLETYTRIKNERDVLAMNAHDFGLFKQELYEAGVALTEMQDLCMATKISLGHLKTLLDLQGPDHIQRNFKRTIRPTGLHAGNSSPDNSRSFGTYDQLGLLPLKIAAIDLLTAPSSTMQWAWWRIPKPTYAASGSGFYTYLSLFPKEFTDIVSTSVSNNMGFANDKTRDKVALSVLNLYLPFFLERAFLNTNDKVSGGFYDQYIQTIRRQTKFDFTMNPVLLETIKDPDKEEPIRYGFRPKLLSRADNKLYELDDAFVLPEREVIIRGSSNRILLPITKLRWLDQDNAYVWALQLTWDKASLNDRLESISVKKDIDELAGSELSRCIDGDHGLSSYFYLKGFPGFPVTTAIASDGEAQRNFEQQVVREFEKYHDKNDSLEQRFCKDSREGMGLITATAMSLNGFILPQTFDYVPR